MHSFTFSHNYPIRNFLLFHTCHTPWLTWKISI
jgi:hypothetical protein